MENSSLRLFLQSLCQNSPWDYAVFWKLQKDRNLILTWEDGYYNVQSRRSSDEILSSTFELSSCIESSDRLSFGTAMLEMATMCYAIGDGVVGEAAYIGVPRWVFSCDISNEAFNSSFISQCAVEWLPQFAAGIKTILLIPSMPDGVLQLGSFETVAEDAELVTNVQDMLAAAQKFAEYRSSFWLPMEVQHQSLAMMSAHAENLYESFAVMRSNMNVVDAVASVRHQLFEQNRSEATNSEIDRSLSQHEMGVFSSYNNNHARVFTEHTNEMIDFYIDDVAMEPPLSIDYDNIINQNTHKFLSFPRNCELHKAHGPNVDHSIQYTHASSDPVGVVAGSSLYDGNFNHSIQPSLWDSTGRCLGVDDENLLEAVPTNANSIPDYSVFNLPINESSFKYPSRRFISNSEGCEQSPRSCVTSATGYGNALTNSSPSTTSYDPITSARIGDKPQAKGYDLLHHKNTLNPSTTNKKRARPGDNQKSKPRDRQLIQARIEELRELVPNVAKCSIDGLLDKTIKHMVFLQSVTDRADKLRQQVVNEVSERVRANSTEMKDNGTSWALDLSNEKQICPIIVKDLEFPGQMLIEMVCDDYGRFLEITDVIRRLELTILKGVMEKLSDGTRAQFIVETTESFHRLDLFWPLMQLLQQNPFPSRARFKDYITDSNPIREPL